MANLLVAEDENDIRELVRSVLVREGHRVIEASNGDDTWKLLEKEQVDLLLLDVMLPGIDGHTLSVQMSGNARLAKIPVIVFSALEGADELFHKFPQVKAFLTKPFLPIQLVNTVRQFLPSPPLTLQ